MRSYCYNSELSLRKYLDLFQDGDFDDVDLLEISFINRFVQINSIGLDVMKAVMFTSKVFQTFRSRMLCRAL